MYRCVRLRDEPLSDKLDEYLSTGAIPYFVVDAASAIYGGILSGLGLLAMGTYVVLELPFVAVVGILFAAVGAYGVYSGVELLGETTWRAQFFNDYARYGKTSMPGRIEYGQIERLTKEEVAPPLKRTRTRVVIYPNDGSRPIAIPFNAGNPILGIDLYSWLEPRLRHVPSV